jgi:hypothetical protein
MSMPEAVGRHGDDLMNVVFPTPEVRFVAAQRFHPFSGEPKIAIRVVAPELRERPNAKVFLPSKRPKDQPYGMEVHFAQQDYQTAELFANKCLIVLAKCVIEDEQLTRDAFYNQACTLVANDLHKGRMPAGKRVVTIQHGEEDRDRTRVPRKAF